MRFQPTGNRLLIRRDEVQEFSEGGIVIPDEFHRYEHPPQWGTVLGVGTRDNHDGIEVGDRVLVAKFTGDDLTIHDEKMFVAKFEDVLAIDD